MDSFFQRHYLPRTLPLNVRGEKILIVGDDPIMKNHPLYRKDISIGDAQAMCDLLVEAINQYRGSARTCHRVTVVEGRETTRRHGSIRGLFSTAPTMRLNKPTEGIVIHELAHLSNYIHAMNCKHGWQFKALERFLLKTWTECNRMNVAAGTV